MQLDRSKTRSVVSGGDGGMVVEVVVISTGKSIFRLGIPYSSSNMSVFIAYHAISYHLIRMPFPFSNTIKLDNNEG